MSPAMTSVSKYGNRDVPTRWNQELGNGLAITIWRDPTVPGQQRIRSSGEPPKEIVDADSVYLVKPQG